jgi:hypothetical protein
MSTDHEPGWRQRMLADFEAKARAQGPVDEETVAALMAEAIRLDRDDDDWEDYPGIGPG